MIEKKRYSTTNSVQYSGLHKAQSALEKRKALGTYMTNVGTRTGIGNTDVIGHESESKDPSQNNSEPGALSQIPNCNALGNDTVTNVGTRDDIGNRDGIGHESESKGPSQKISDSGALSQFSNSNCHVLKNNRTGKTFGVKPESNDPSPCL